MTRGGARQTLEKPKGGWSPVCEAAAVGDVNMIQHLVLQAQEYNQGDILNMETMYGDTPLLIAAMKSQVNCITALIQLKVESQPLHADLKTINFILTLFCECFQADPRYENRYGEHCLIRAALSEAFESVRAIVATKKIPVGHENTKGDTALTRACQQNRITMATNLIRLKSDVNWETNKGTTALNAAAANDLCDLAKQLVELGADVNQETRYTQQTPVMTASANSKARMIEFLYKMGGNIDYETKVGDTALSFAAKRGILQALDDLLEKGATIECDTKMDGYSPLGHAVMQSQMQACQLLLKKNAQVNREMTNHCTPLTVAAENGDQDLVEFLIKQKAHADFETTKMENAMCLASRHNHASTVRLLFHMKANPNRRYMHLADHSPHSPCDNCIPFTP